MTIALGISTKKQTQTNHIRHLRTYKLNELMFLKW